ncbi:hypothetical protein N8471_05155 [Polaribacter sp.]|nr:hypothetical protein [Polaribacter sp.]
MKPVSLLEAQKNLLISQEVFLVDNSIEISNISFTPRDFNDTVKQIELLIHKI